jgi:glycosyltransferase involved in cell wall biosynthesis
MNGPVISVVIPAYNMGKWLDDAIKSVLAQTFQEWELLIVNDGSTDNTLALAHSYNDCRIHVIDQANAGVSAARNAGITAACGDYLYFMDADDVMLPENLALKLQAIQELDVDWVFADIEACDHLLRRTGKVLRGTDEDVLRTLLLQDKPAVPLSCGNILAHKHCFGQGLRFDERLSNAADQDLTMQLAAKFKYAHIPGALTLYRNVPCSMSKDIERFQKDHLQLFRIARDRGLLQPPYFRRRCMANVYWAIGGSWWLLAGRPLKAIPFLAAAVALWPAVAIRPLRKRLGLQPSGR